MRHLGADLLEPAALSDKGFCLSLPKLRNLTSKEPRVVASEDPEVGIVPYHFVLIIEVIRSVMLYRCIYGRRLMPVAERAGQCQTCALQLLPLRAHSQALIRPGIDRRLLIVSDQGIQALPQYPRAAAVLCYHAIDRLKTSRSRPSSTVVRALPLMEHFHLIYIQLP